MLIKLRSLIFSNQEKLRNLTVDFALPTIKFLGE